MYRLRQLGWVLLKRLRRFCIKQRYVSIKTIAAAIWVLVSGSALSSDMYRLRLTGTGVVSVIPHGSALSSDMYRLRHIPVTTTGN